MEGADVRGAVAEHAEDDIFCLFILDGKTGATRQRQVPAHDAVPAHEAMRVVEDVHGTAAAMRHAGFAAEELGHHVLRVDSPRDRVAMLAIARVDVVAGF